MTTATVFSRAFAGLDAPAVSVEVHLSNGLPGFTIVGLPESSVREARERVRSALLTSHYEWPDHRITVSLAPADIPKGGGRFDLPIALGLLAASGQLPESCLPDREFYGELGLDGSIRATRGILAAVRAASDASRLCGVSSHQAALLAAIPGSKVVGAPDLLTLCGYLREDRLPLCRPIEHDPSPENHPDIGDVRGQASAKRGLELAASGGHHLLMVGPPGAGKTMLASTLPGIMPTIGAKEAIDLLIMRDLMGLPSSTGRPFRSPHHSASGPALIGGGSHALPGEVSLAHGGILFLDELPEFAPRVLDLLRQPLESGNVTIARARGVHCYPARFQLVAAMNPCPCGFWGDPAQTCRCSGEKVAHYQNRVSGPLLDRIDLHLQLERQPAATLFSNTSEEQSEDVRARVTTVRQRQFDRQGRLNNALSGTTLMDACQLNRPLLTWFEQSCDRLQISSRGVHRILRVARTLADMAGDTSVQEPALLEALSYRPS